MGDLAATVSRNMVFAVVGRFSLKVISFLFSVLVVRRLGGISYGEYSTVIAFVGIFAIFSDWGMTPYALREIAKDRDKTPSLFWNISLLRMVLSALVVAIIVSMAMMSDYSQDMVLGIFIASLGLFIYAIQGPLDAILRGYERVDYASVLSVVNQIVFMSIGTVVLLWGKGFIGLIIASLMGPIVLIAISLVVIVRKFGRISFVVDVRVWPALMKAGIPFGVMVLLDTVIRRLDVLLLFYFEGSAAVGQYSAVYNNLILSLIIASQGINSALLPSLSREYTNSPQRAVDIYQRAIKYLFVMAVPLAVGGIVLGDELLVSLYGEEYAPAIPVLYVLMGGLPLMFMNGILTSLAKVMNREKGLAKIVTIKAVANVILNLLLIPGYGFVGSAIAKVIVPFIGLILFHHFTLREEIRSLDYVTCFVRPTIAALLMGMCVLLGRTLTAAHWLLLVAVGAVAYTISIFLTRTVTAKEVRAVGAFVGLGPR